MLQQENKNGISLIILVITIIIVIILAGAVIVSLNNSGVITKAKLAKESSEFTSIREAVELEKQNMLLTGTFDKNKIDIPNIYKDDIEVTGAGEILIKYNENTKIIDMANAIKILGASYISNGFDEIQSISGGTASAGETKLAKIIIEGKSEQVVTTQNANLLDESKLSLPVPSTVSATQTTRLKEYNSFQYPSGTYQLSHFANTNNITFGTNGRVGLRVLQYNADNSIGNYAYTTYTGNASERKTVSVNLVSGLKTVIDLTYGGTVSGTWTFDDIMLSAQNVSYTSFVPDSPSPSYPSIINSVSDFDLVSSGKNLFDNSMVNSISNCTYSNGIYTQSVADTSTYLNWKIQKFLDSSYIGTIDTVRKDNTGRVKLSFTKDNSFNELVFGLNGNVRDTKINMDISHLLDGVSYVISANIINVDQGSIAWNNMQLEKGTVMTPYESYQGNKINFQYTLRGLPDGTKDYIEIDNLAKNAKYFKNVGEKVLNGTESYMELLVGTNYVRVRTTLVGVKGDWIDNSMAYRCTHSSFGIVVPTYTANAQGVVIDGRNSNSWTYLSIDKTLLSSFDIPGVQSWLAANPVTVQYKLATPTVTDLTYQELQIGYPFTNIYTTSTVKPKIIGQVTNK